MKKRIFKIKYKLITLYIRKAIMNQQLIKLAS